MNKPANQYRPGSILERLYNGDWSRCTAQEIADVLNCTQSTIRKYVSKIMCETGKDVPYLRISRYGDPQKTVEPSKLPPSYQPKKAAVPRKCSTCGNVECAGCCRAVCWTGCGMWRPVEGEEAQSKIQVRQVM